MHYLSITGLPPLILATVLLFTGQLAAQTETTYQLSFKREAPYFLGSALLLVKGEQLRRNLVPVAIDDILRADRFDPGIDNIPFLYGRHRADRLSDYTMYASGGLTLALVASRKSRSDFGRIALLYAETMLVNQGLTHFTKSVFRRPRPYVLNPAWSEERPVYSGDRSSMISGHTSGAAAGAFFFARVFADYYPDSRLKPYVWVTAATLPAVTGFLRVRAAKHYPSDVVAGYALGAAVGYLVPVLHKKPLLDRRLILSPAGTGLSASYNLR